MTQNMVFQTELDSGECIKRILKKPWKYGDPMFGVELWYECEWINEKTLSIVFAGRQYRKTAKSAYLMRIEPIIGGSRVTLSFQEEQAAGFFQKLLGLAFPSMTITHDVDGFMRQKINARRIVAP